ncbi:MAG: TolC family protein, partial [Gammaproteobacteria bacterium]
PLFHNNESQIQQALAQRKQKQLEIIELQTRLLNELDRKRQNYLDKLAAYQNSLQLLDALTNKATQVEKQFELGYSDQLNVLRTKLEIEKANQAIFDIELDVMRAAVKLESLTQSPILTSMQNLNFTIEQDIAGYPK